MGILQVSYVFHEPPEPSLASRKDWVNPEETVTRQHSSNRQF